MDPFSAPDAKKNLGELPAGERQRARQEQRQVEQGRLAVHQSIGIALLSDAKQRRNLLQAAHAEVARWERDKLCSRDYIDRWTTWLALPVGQLVESMCSDAAGWGNAMRQNSPFAAVRG